MRAKTLKDLVDAGWKKLLKLRSPMGNLYATYISPDEGQLAQVHVDDGEISILFDRKTGKITWLHPTTELGMKRVGFTKERLEKVLRKSEGII